MPVVPVVVCPDEQVILDLALGTLAPAARQEAWAHVERCPSCAELIGAALPFLGPEPPPAAGKQGHPDTPGAGSRDSDLGTTGAGADTVPGPQTTEPTARSLQPGQDLRQRYRVVRYLGHGGMGEVYEARHARLVGRYALKILNVDLTHNPMARQRFRREAGIASELRHPNIVQVIDFDETENGRPYLVMEMLEGSDLGAIIAAGPLSLARTLALARQIAAGLAAMHAQGIVHRDLKPANVFVLPEGTGQPERIKLVDFGLSKRLAPSLAVTHDRMLLGTPQYMAPEQARGNSDTLGPAADQFAMAAIIYEMLAGRPAFDAELLSVVLYRIVHEPPAPLASLVPGLPPAIEAAIARALAKEPEQRFPSVTEFWDALAAGAGAGAMLVSGLAGNASQARPTWTGRRVRSLALSAGVVGAGLGLTWLLARSDREVGERSHRALIAAQPQPAVVWRLENHDPEPARSQVLPILKDGKTTTLTEVVPVRPARKKVRRSGVSEAAVPTKSPEPPPLPAPTAVQPASATESSSSVPAETPLAVPDPLPPPSNEAETPAVTKEPLVPHL